MSGLSLNILFQSCLSLKTGLARLVNRLLMDIKLRWTGWLSKEKPGRWRSNSIKSFLPFAMSCAICKPAGPPPTMQYSCFCLIVNKSSSSSKSSLYANTSAGMSSSINTWKCLIVPSSDVLFRGPCRVCVCATYGNGRVVHMHVVASAYVCVCGHGGTAL